jgi:hypothetical protein
VPARWYAVRFLIELRVDEEAAIEPPTRFEDHLILVGAQGEAEALTKAMDFAQRAEEQYVNALGETVSWTFRHILDVHEILDAELQDGTEVYSAILDRGPGRDPGARERQPAQSLAPASSG